MCRKPVLSRHTAVTLNASAMNDLTRIAEFAKENHVALHVAAVPDSFQSDMSKDMFDSQEMRRLYQVAYEQATTGDPWQVQPNNWQKEHLSPATTQPASP
jgi:hypothetical protein